MIHTHIAARVLKPVGDMQEEGCFSNTPPRSESQPDTSIWKPMINTLAGTPQAVGVETLQLAPTPLRLKTILVPTDFSEPSYNALRHALSLAQQFGSSMQLIHVMEPVYPYPVDGLSSYPGDLPSVSLYDRTGDAEKTLTRLRDAAAGLISAPVEKFFRIGRAYDEIVRAARDCEADLIVIATHGYTGLKHVFLGSTAERVVRHAPCPVLVLRSRAEPPPTDQEPAQQAR